MTPEQEERFVAAFETIAESISYIAGTVESIAAIAAQDLEKRYPPKRTPAEATVTRLKTEEELLRENQGATGEEKLEDWATLGDDPTTGPREAAWLDKNKSR